MLAPLTVQHLLAFDDQTRAGSGALEVRTVRTRWHDRVPCPKARGLVGFEQRRGEYREHEHRSAGTEDAAKLGEGRIERLEVNEHIAHPDQVERAFGEGERLSERTGDREGLIWIGPSHAREVSWRGSTPTTLQPNRSRSSIICLPIREPTSSTRVVDEVPSSPATSKRNEGPRGSMLSSSTLSLPCS